jgi:hypothetical protein
MASKIINKQQEPPTRKRLGKRFYWGSKDANHGLPRYDCQSPVHKRRKIKGLDCGAHARILHERLQQLLDTENVHKLHGGAREGTARENKIKSNAQQNQESGSQPRPRVKQTSIAITYRQIQPPIPLEVPRINSNYPAIPPPYMGISASTSTSTSAVTGPNNIPLFDPSSLQKTGTQGLRCVVPMNVYCAGYNFLRGTWGTASF